MTTEALAIIVISVIGLLLLADFGWKKWYFSNSEPIDAEVVAVRKRTMNDKKNNRNSYSVRVNYTTADGDPITTHLRVKDVYHARLPQGIIDAAGETMNLVKVKNRMQEAHAISSKMLAEGKSKDEVKQAITELYEGRRETIERKTEDLGLAPGWVAVTTPTTIPVLVSNKNNKKAMLYTKGLSKSRS